MTMHSHCVGRDEMPPAIEVSFVAIRSAIAALRANEAATIRAAHDALRALGVAVAASFQDIAAQWTLIDH